MPFPDALKLALNGSKIVRTTWIVSRGTHVSFDPDTCTVREYFGDSSRLWHPTQADMQAMDWELVR